MTVPAAERKAGPFNGNGSTTSFPFEFKVFTTADVEIVVADADGIETVLELDSDYSVSLNSDQDATPGGTVTYPISGSALASGEKLSIAGALAYEQETDIPAGGNFNPTVLENALDKLSMQTQQLAESVSRAAKVPITNAADADTLTQAILVAANNIAGLEVVVANISDIQTVADDLNEATSEINTVATSIDNVDAVGTNIAHVIAVDGNETNINAVAANETNIDTVAGINANVTTVAGIAANVTTVAGISANVTSVAGNATNINAVAGNSTNINAVNANKTNIDAVAGNATNINTVAGNNSNVTTVAGISADVTTVAGISADVAAVENIAANVTTVAGISTAVSTVATNNTNVSTVATNISAINTVATDIAQIITTANDLNEAVSEIDTVATNIADVQTVGAAIADVSAVAAIAADVSIAADNVADIQNFADVYQGPSATAPTLRNDGSALQAGDLYFYTGTGTKEMKVYNGSSWIAVGSSVNGILAQFKYVAAASQTSFSGSDANGLTLSYDAGFIIVFLNGVRLDAADYTASNGTTVVLGSGAAANDEVVIVAFGNFSLANHYTKAEDDALLAAKVAKSGDTMTGNLTLSQAGSGRTLAITNTSDSDRGFIARTRSGGVQIGTNSSIYELDLVIDGNAKQRIDTNFQRLSVLPSGSTLYPAFDCRAWVNFNGTGTVAIRASGNVSSITDNAVGDYSVNLTTAMPDMNAAIVFGKSNQVTNSGNATGANFNTTSSFGIVNYEGNSKVDGANLYFAVFR